MPISTHYGEREVLHQLRETEVKSLITSDNLYAQVRNLISEVQGLQFIVLEGQGELPSNTIPFSSLLGGSDRLDRSIGIDPKERIAVLPFSSRITAFRKGSC